MTRRREDAQRRKVKLAMPAILCCLAASCSQKPHASELNPDTVTAVQSPAQAANFQVGRYQLMAAEHMIAPKGTAYIDKDVFRIDTATGHTDILVSGTNGKGRHEEFWAPIGGFVEATSPAQITAVPAIPPGFEIESTPPKP